MLAIELQEIVRDQINKINLTEKIVLDLSNCQVMGVQKRMHKMKRTLNTFGTLLRSSSVCIISFLVLVVLTIMLWQAHLVTGWQSLGLIAYLSGMLDAAMLVWLLVLLTLRSHASANSPKVLAALILTLQQDPDPRVRSKAVVGLIQLDLEQSFDHHEHNKLDDILIHTLQQDPDPRVRSKAAVGLAELELEQEKPTYHHKHNKLDNMLFEECR
jgi:hypothetical protein